MEKSTKVLCVIVRNDDDYEKSELKTNVHLQPLRHLHEDIYHVIILMRLRKFILLHDAVSNIGNDPYQREGGFFPPYNRNVIFNLPENEQFPWHFR